MVSDPIPPTPNLSPPPSNESLLSLSLSTPITPRPPSTDPRVHLRGWPHLLQGGGEQLSLKEVREHEGTSKRLERLREVFESIPDPPLQQQVSILQGEPTTTTTTKTLSPDNVTAATKETVEEERKRWESERKTYMKELWTKCGAETSPPTSTTTTTTTTPKTSSSPLLPSTNQTTTHPLPSSSSSPAPNLVPSSCLRWSSFESYADGQERLLYSIFSELDSDNNLKLTAQDVENACKKAGVEVDREVVDGFVKVLDRDGDGMIGWEEWRDFLIVRSSLSLFTFLNTFPFSRMEVLIIRDPPRSLRSLLLALAEETERQGNLSLLSLSNEEFETFDESSNSGWRW